jgi:hypothetical protein
MTKQEIEEQGYEGVILFHEPDYDGCIIGITTDGRAVYSLAQMVMWFYEKNDCTAEEALEFIDYNTIGSLTAIENGPLILDDL